MPAHPERVRSAPLPEGYRFGNAKFPGEVFRAPCGCHEVETRHGASSLYACADHGQGEQAYEAICVAKYVTPAFEALADRVVSGKILPMDVPILRAMGWNVIDVPSFGVYSGQGDEA